jgi:Flp pilus assembly protein TadD
MKRIALLALLALAPAAGCSRPAASPHAAGAPAVTTRRAQALIDSGNAAFREKDYDLAARRYASAVALDPADPAAHYGLGMALARLGRDDEAREAYARSRALQARRADTVSAGR